MMLGVECWVLGVVGGWVSAELEYGFAQRSVAKLGVRKSERAKERKSARAIYFDDQITSIPQSFPSAVQTAKKTGSNRTGLQLSFRLNLKQKDN
jgi:hypothetical protein